MQIKTKISKIVVILYLIKCNHNENSMCIGLCCFEKQVLLSVLISNLSVGSTAVPAKIHHQKAYWIVQLYQAQYNLQIISRIQVYQLNQISSSTLPIKQIIYKGYFQNSSYYLKFYETIKQAYNSYKKSRNLGAYDRFFINNKEHSQIIFPIIEIVFVSSWNRATFRWKCDNLCLKSLFSQSGWSNLWLYSTTIEFIN